jgi:predicted trehalose synthase
VRIYGKMAVLTGPVDVKPPKGDLYRVRTLEVYTQNAAGVWQMAQKESVRIPIK